MVNRRDNARRYSRDAYGSASRRDGDRARRSDRASRAGRQNYDDAYGDQSDLGSYDEGRGARSARSERSARSGRANYGSRQDAERFGSRSSRNARGAYDEHGSSVHRRRPSASEDNPYSRDRVSQGDYYSKRKSRRKKLAVGLTAAVLVIVLGLAGGAWAYVQSISGQLHEGVDDSLLNALVDTQYEGDPFYMLLMGSDGSAERENSTEFAGDTFRADTTILARIDPKGKTVSLISIPRDTRCDMGEYGVNKLNAAHSLGGAALAVETVSNLAGVDITHYAAINFDGFREAVNALGGIEVDVPMEIDDPQAGGYLAAGPQTLDGDQALILCRSRHAYDEYGPGDLYRAANQRLVLSAIAKKLLASDPVTIATTVQSLASYVATDMDVMEIVGVANSLRGLDTDSSMFSATAPTVSEHTTAWYEVIQQAEWEAMMDRVDRGLPPTEGDVVDPVSGTILANAGDALGAKAEFDATRTGDVSVKNGTGISGLAAEAAEIISGMGYDTTTGNANGSFDKTVVVYATDEQREYAQEIVDALGVGTAVKNQNEYIYTGDFLVVVGADWPQ